MGVDEATFDLNEIGMDLPAPSCAPHACLSALTVPASIAGQCRAWRRSNSDMVLSRPLLDGCLEAL